MRWILLLLMMSSLAAEARAERRWALIVGNNSGLPSESPLRFAEEDAKKVQAVFRELGGVEADDMLVLLGEDAETVRRALVRFNERIRQANPREATLIVYYSGHADERALHLGPTRLEVDELESLVRGSAAAFRLVVVDACRSGALTRVKGGKVRPAVPIAPRVATTIPSDGVVLLTASTESEDAQESEAIGGSFFTHYLVSGMRGAADDDSDGEVDLDEAYRFAYDHTVLASSASAVGPQHPTFRYETKGKSPLTLTYVGAPHTALLELPAGASWFVFARGRGLLAEVPADSPRRRVALRPQRVSLRGRTRDALLEAEVELVAGRTVDASRLTMTRTAYARLVRKGGGGPVAANGLELGYRLGGALETDASPVHGAWLGWVHEREGVSLHTRLGLTYGSWETRGPSDTNFVLRADSLALEFTLGGRRVFDLPGLSLELGLDLGAAWLHQSFDWVGVAPSRDSAAFRAAALVGATVDLSAATYLRLDASLVLWLFPRRVDSAAERVTPELAPRLELGVGWRW